MSLWLFPFQGLLQEITVFHFNLFNYLHVLPHYIHISPLCPTFWTPIPIHNLKSLLLLLLTAFPFSGVCHSLGLPLGLLRGTSISSILLSMCPLSLLCTCPNYTNLASLAFSQSLPVCLCRFSVIQVFSKVRFLLATGLLCDQQNAAEN